jgi:hypothetical protein
MKSVCGSIIGFRAIAFNGIAAIELFSEEQCLSEASYANGFIGEISTAR